jgi:UDP-glucose 4-epimerase
MKILVTGAVGFIASSILEQVLKEGHEVLGMDDLSIHNRKLPRWLESNELLKSAKLVLGSGGNCVDEYNMRDEIKNFEPDIIFNLAVVPLEHSLVYPEDNFRTNLSILLHILAYMRQNQTRLVHFSSSEVYGSAKTSYMNENHVINPNTPYAASKAACDSLVKSYVRTFGIDAVIVRPFNTIGPRQTDGTYAAIIPKTVKRIKEGKRPVISGTGNNTRDYTYVGDVVNGAIAAMDHGVSGETYNLCTGIETSTIDMMTMIAEEMKYKGEFDFIEDRKGDVKRHRGDNTKAKKELGWTPNVSIREAVRRAIHD